MLWTLDNLYSLEQTGVRLQTFTIGQSCPLMACHQGAIVDWWIVTHAWKISWDLKGRVAVLCIVTAIVEGQLVVWKWSPNRPARGQCCTHLLFTMFWCQETTQHTVHSGSQSTIYWVWTPGNITSEPWTRLRAYHLCRKLAASFYVIATTNISEFCDTIIPCQSTAKSPMEWKHSFVLDTRENCQCTIDAPDLLKTPSSQLLQAKLQAADMRQNDTTQGYRDCSLEN